MSKSLPHNTDIVEEAPALVGAVLITDYVKRLPHKPGVYRMIGQAGDILYVGKAKNLKKRVTSYAQSGRHTNRIQRMISATRAMEFVVTQTETEALLLEANLIKQLKPRYNILMRDDKTFPHILIADDHEAPQITKHRGARKRSGQYYGPFANPTAVNRTLNTLQKAFLLRSCTDSEYENRTRPCLLHQIKRCSAPCVDLISIHDYRTLVDEANAFLNSQDNSIQKKMSKQMEEAAHALDYERAASLRDRIHALSFIQGTQDVNVKTIGNADVFAAYEQDGKTCIQVFFFRTGQNWGNHAYFPHHDSESDLGQIINAFIAQFYDNRPAPNVILTSHNPDQSDLLMEALTLKSDKKVTIITPKRGEKKEIMAAAIMNAKEALHRKQAESASQDKNLLALAKVLELSEKPLRIEVYDNSHIQGAHATGAMIVAGQEGFLKNQYRKFNIKDKTLSPGDDFGMMREVLKRRFSRLIKENTTAPNLQDDHDLMAYVPQWPDLIILDGGKGQLSAALEVIEELKLEGYIDDLEKVNSEARLKLPTFVSIAKPKRETSSGKKTSDRTMGAMAEQIFMENRAPFLISPRDPALFFIQRLRDEAHRYAISAHRAKRSKAVSANPLDDIAGVGASRKRALLNHFGSAKAIARVKPQDLAQVEGISDALAQRIFDFFHSDQ